MRRFLFIIPNAYNSRENKQERRKCIPYGVLSIVTYVEHHCANVQCDVLDLNLFDGWPLQRQVLMERLRTIRYDLVGISSMFSIVKEESRRLVREIYAAHAVSFIVLGGICPSNNPELFFDGLPELDAICCGEGEIPFRELAEAEDMETVFHTHPAWLTAEDMAGGKSGRAVYVTDLDDIPPIRYDKVPVKEYGSRIQDDHGGYRLALPIHTTRGCPYRCVFCCAGANHGRSVRAMSAQRVVDDIAAMKAQYGIDMISIDDDQFLFLNERAKQILTELIPLGLELEFASGLNVCHIDEEIAGLLKRAGANTVVIAIESGSQRVLNEVIHKPLKLNEVAQVAEWLHHNDIQVDAFMMVGLPEETEDDLELTRHFMRTAPVDWYIINVAQPYQGSKLYDQCLANGWLRQSRENGMLSWYIETEQGFADRMQKLRYQLKIEMNYLNNYNLRSGNYKKALSIFRKTADGHPNHAISQYCAAKACAGLGDLTTARYYFERYRTALQNKTVWKEYVQTYSLPTQIEVFLQEEQHGKLS